MTFPLVDAWVMAGLFAAGFGMGMWAVLVLTRVSFSPHRARLVPILVCDTCNRLADTQHPPNCQGRATIVVVAPYTGPNARSFTCARGGVHDRDSSGLCSLGGYHPTTRIERGDLSKPISTPLVPPTVGLSVTSPDSLDSNMLVDQ